LNQHLLFEEILAILRAMLRILLLLISIVWATLLLISWSGPIDASLPPDRVNLEAS